MTVALSFAQAAAATGGALTAPAGCATALRGVSTDSRAVAAGEAFVALVGERFDGHAYCAQAVARGAALLVVSQPVSAPAGVGVLCVADTRRALGALGRCWRDEVAPTVVAITGSVGKTTTKELAAAVAADGGPTHHTRGNLNNDIGVPLTLLAMPRATRCLVVELGMNAPGEIAYLAGLVRPDVGAVTNVAPVHLEGLGSLAAIARAKGELLDALDAERWAVLPGDEPLLAPHVAQLPASRRITFGRAAADRVRVVDARAADTRGVDVTLRIDDATVRFLLPLVGRHNAVNAAAAAAIGLALGRTPAAIAAALAGARPAMAHRASLRAIGPWRVLDDCYNASPRAMQAALHTLVDLAAGAPAVAVLGTMLELGRDAARLHREVGAHAATLPLEALITVGPAAAAIADGARGAGLAPARIHEAADAQAAAALLAARSAGGWLLVKASRGARLEELLDALEQRFPAASEDAGGTPAGR